MNSTRCLNAQIKFFKNVQITKLLDKIVDILNML